MPEFLTDFITICDSMRDVVYLFLGGKFFSVIGKSSVLQTYSRDKGGFPKLRRCCMELGSWDNADEAVRSFKDSQDLEWWTSLPRVMDEDTAVRKFTYCLMCELKPLIQNQNQNLLARNLSTFPKLARIDFGEKTLPSDAFLLHFAQKITSLQKIYIYRAHRRRFEVVTTYEVCRDDTHLGEPPLLKKLYELSSTGGPYIQDRRVIPPQSINWQEEVKLDGWSHCAYAPKIIY